MFVVEGKVSESYFIFSLCAYTSLWCGGMHKNVQNIDFDPKIE